MTLRDALKLSGWEVFQNSQNEKWNTTDLLNTIQPGESPQWLDAEVLAIGAGYIIDCAGDELIETA